jgi:secreted Zn-dependent insulinase-like peptidase
MTWEDLLRQRRVQQLPPDRAEFDALREVVERNLRDAAIPELSSDARAGLSYDAARSAANMAVRAEGYRVRGLRSHETTFEALSIIGAPLAQYADDFQVLRIKRNALTYVTAGETSDAEAVEALGRARELIADVIIWLADRSDLHP